MTNAELMSKCEMPKTWGSDFVIPSSLDIRHSSFIN